MFIGHFGVGLGAKSIRPAISLGTLFLASQLLDLMWPTFLLMGLEEVTIQPGITEVTPLNFTHYPISHSLLLVLGWSLLAGVLYWILRRKREGARLDAMVVGLCVLSHWLLDVIMHRPDLPLYPGDSPMLGLGLWNSLAGSVVVESILFAAGVVLYARSTSAQDRIGSIGFWSLIGSLVLIHVGNLFGPPPTNTTDIAWAGQLQWILVLWAYWVDKHRVPAGGTVRMA
ncbi:hypothetical protein [Telluribacter sp. SYSU D00476]|uniref:hypothetical protein n=1 Tax=Telluribacter sp. SYSU D00476 TaxID=2811430 RepID=UPI001FF4B7F0|nr:hypothetical protein [Telluribacter sp. SYSU D00476]